MIDNGEILKGITKLFITLLYYNSSTMSSFEVICWNQYEWLKNLYISRRENVVIN